MLYVLPPPRAPDPPSPWSSIFYNGGDNNGADRTSWDSQPKRPPRARLRNLQFKDEGSHQHHQGVQDVNMGTNHNPKSLSECYFAGKGTALVLPAADAQKSKRTGQGTKIQRHLQAMFYLLRPEETLKMAVKLESVHPSRTRYLVVVSRMGTRAEESCLLGIDCNETTTVGMVLKVMADTTIRLDGDGGFSVSVCGSHHIFKPVSVQAMWSALQTLHKVSSKAREENYYQSGVTHAWVDYYDDRIESDRSCLNEWHAMDNLESKRPASPDSVRTKPTEREQTERVIRTTLKEIMMSVDLDEVTSKYIRTRLEEDLDMDLGEYKSFIDQEMLTILGQMDAPTEIFEHVYLGSEWNASNYEELQRNGVGHILNVTREIDNFFPGAFDYLNVRVCDDEATNLLKHWDDTFKYITKARIGGSKVLVHCKMGVSRSASVVIAYAMKAYDWDFKTAMRHVKEKRTCIKPNASFLTQLETYQGMLDAMKNKEKLQRSKSETNLKNNVKNRQEVSNGDGDGNEKRQDSLQITLSGQDLRGFGVRPKSWSPDNVEVVDKSPTFLSLEDLSQKDKASHVLMPRDNGESYSVSPNQIVHLQGQIVASSVKEIVSELESKKTWDPGDSLPISDCDKPCAKIESQRVDLFSNRLDRVFDREEKKPREESITRECPSRQSSWSSYDSAVVLEANVLSRHSSWGSGDTTRTGPSRNSSWGSYDMRPRSDKYDKEEIPRHPGTVKRTKQKIEENRKRSDSSETLFEYSTSVTLETTVEAINPVLVTVDDDSAISATIAIPSDKLTDLSRLSMSAPVASGMMDLLPYEDHALSRSTSNASALSKKKKSESTTGLVKNLKKEFEAKTALSTNNLNEESNVTIKKVSSLPSSPIIIAHQDDDKKCEVKSPEELPFESLVGIFEPNKVVSKRPKTSRSFSARTCNNRYSCIVDFPDGGGGTKRPPISPVVRTTPPSLVVATVIAKAAKKQQQQQQQYGKSHPLARLNIKSRHGSPVYNTM